VGKKGKGGKKGGKKTPRCSTAPYEYWSRGKKEVKRSRVKRKGKKGEKKEGDLIAILSTFPPHPLPPCAGTGIRKRRGKKKSNGGKREQKKEKRKGGLSDDDIGSGPSKRVGGSIKKRRGE